MKINNKLLETVAILIFSIIGLGVGGYSLYQSTMANSVSLTNQSVVERNEKAITEMNKELAKIKEEFNVAQLSLQAYEFSFLKLQKTQNKLISELFKGRRVPQDINILNFGLVGGYFEEPFSASSLKEAMLMAYIDKHPQDFSYKAITIEQYGDSIKRQDAIIGLVKEQGVENLFNRIAPLIKSIK